MTENVSNLCDQSVDDSELNKFLHDCRSNPALAETWQRYQLASAALRDEILDLEPRFDVANKVMEEIRDGQSRYGEPEVLPFTSPVPNRRFPRPWIPLALAASLGLVAYLGMIRFTDVPPQATPQLAESPAVNTMPHWQTSNAAVERTLNSLLVEHSEFTSVTGMNGLGSYSKFVAYQN